MEWKRGYRSSDVEIRKDSGDGGGGGGGLFNLLASLVISRFGLIGGLVVLGIGAFLSSNLLNGSSSAVAPSAQEEAAARSDPRVEFVSFVLDDVQANWERVFTDRGARYSHAKMVLFDRHTPTACGYGRAATGPFYCPRDRSVYLDLSFFRELDKLGAPGNFAQAYVIAHEVGHHVQNLLGTTERVERAPARALQGAGGLSVKVELQADCYAGVWAASTAQRKLMEQGDLEQALRAAAAVGDDHLQRMEAGTVEPERWTHGSSAERAAWFRRGYERGDMNDCDTFDTASR